MGVCSVPRHDVEIEIIVFSQFRDSAIEIGLQNAALVLTAQVNARKQALAKTAPQSFQFQPKQK
jgi:hypothetical protein